MENPELFLLPRRGVQGRDKRLKGITLNSNRGRGLKARLRKNQNLHEGVCILFISKMELLKTYESGCAINPVLQED